MDAEHDPCAEAVVGSVGSFSSELINVEACDVEYRENSHGEPSMFVVVHLTSPEGSAGWPIDAVYELRETITEAAISTDCDIPVYMQIEEAEPSNASLATAS